MKSSKENRMRFGNSITLIETKSMECNATELTGRTPANNSKIDAIFNSALMLILYLTIRLYLFSYKSVHVIIYKVQIKALFHKN